MAKTAQRSSSLLGLLPESDCPSFDFACARDELCKRAEARSPDDRIHFARAATAAVATDYWVRTCAATGPAIPIRLPPIPSSEISDRTLEDYAAACVGLDLQEAFYHIGELYTSLLPVGHRAKFGIYYTPPPLVARLLDLLEQHGVNWAEDRILDPACGGAAFAAYVVQRMLRANEHLSAEDRLRDISDRLVGFDIDPFAAWLSAVLLDVVCLPVLRTANRQIDGIIRVGDTLSQHPESLGKFDVVLGNPPYGKVRLPQPLRQRFSRSLFGHANIYGVFTDLAVSFTRPGGLIAFVTPTSFLGGEYFKNLRALLLEEAQPVQASFIADRDDVFADVLQETMLAVFRRKESGARKARRAQRIAVELIAPQSDGRLVVDSLGKVARGQNGSAPWLLPRGRTHLALMRRINAMPARLGDYGYRVSTGQLVWNRHKAQFRDRPGDNCHPVLWAECIQPDGAFAFKAQSRDHRPFIHLEAAQGFLINYEPCILVQRTTSKEQPRRLMAAIVPNSFVVAHPGFVVENHVNMVVPDMPSLAVPLRVVNALLNSRIVDQVFRCISGSVAVSAYEMEAIPLPSPDHLMRRLRLARIPPESPRFEELLTLLYHDGS